MKRKDDMRKVAIKPRIALAALGAFGLALGAVGCSAQTEDDPAPSEPAPAEAAEQGEAEEEEPESQEEAHSDRPLQGATKTAYTPFQSLDEYEAAPAGYEPVLIEHVGRHGSRFLSSKKYDDLLYQLWQQAEADDALTELGEQLGPDLETIIAVHDEQGYGDLSGLGAKELEGIGQRTYQRMQPLFEAAIEADGAITFTSSGEDRATDSGDNFMLGLAAEEPALTDLIEPLVADTDLLYFHKADEEYMDYRDSDSQLLAAMDELEDHPEISPVAESVVSALFTEEFVDRLDAGEFDFVDNGKGKKHLQTVVDAAQYMYQLYIIAPLMAEEAELDFSQYISEEDAEVLGFLAGAETFYEKGPGFEGRDVTYRMSEVLLEDLLSAVEGVASGDTTQVADFRFAHAETILPLAALLQLPGSDVQVPEGESYSYETNPFRAAIVAPMAANLQWDVFQNDEDHVIVRMLYNEEQTPFAFDCEPIEEDSFFYEAEELSECLAHLRP